MCSRLLGLLREQIFAALFGGGMAMDAFTAAFRIPNLLRDLFAEGALSTAFVTTFSKTIARGGDADAWRLAHKVATMTALVLGLLCIVGMIFSEQLVHLLAPGFDPEKAALTAHLTRIMFPFILLVSLAALTMGMLNAKNVFGVPAMASSFFNIGSIVGGVGLGFWIDPHFGPRALIGLAFATLIGGALQFAVQLPSLARLGYRFRPDIHWRDPGVKAILLLMGPAVIAASTTQFNVLVNSMFASTLGDGAIFWLAIAFRLMQLPLGLFGVALGSVTLPLLSRLVVAGRLDAFRSELARAIRWALLLTLPSMVGLIMLAEPIISVLYQHGKFNAYEAAQAAGEAVLGRRPVSTLPQTADEHVQGLPLLLRLRDLAALTSNVSLNASRTIASSADQNISSLITMQIALGIAGLVVSLLLAAALIATTRRQTAHYRSLARSSHDLVLVLGEGGCRRFGYPSLPRSGLVRSKLLQL